ncbi:replication factor C small subunit [Candidatus Woesearchaeota archaeon]|nr:replication factor C small subunit [Candidatus Woesearchaeota archaeon]
MEDSAIWIEKYRPRSFEEIKGQEEIVKRVKAFVVQKNIPHLMFIGPPGVGKTTLALVIGRELFKEEKQENFLELNASDERGIDVIRNKVKDFARTRSLKNVPFKLIYLDECDSLTREAQQALRRTMESYSSSTRFILSCNYSSKIIDPIKSRCTILKFRPLKQDTIKGIIERVAEKENLQITEKAKEMLINTSQGDVRQLENLLQSCAAMSKNIDEQSCSEIIITTEETSVKETLDLVLAGQFIKAKNKLLETMVMNGLGGVDIIKLIQKETWSLNVEDQMKIRIIQECGEAEFRMVEGGNEFIQLEAFLAKMLLITQP